jgi:hypothetical protein
MRRPASPQVCRAPSGRLPTRQVVTEDRPRPARQVIPRPLRLFSIGPRRPCHYRAMSISPERSQPDTHGQLGSARDLARSPRRLVSGPLGLPLYRPDQAAKTSPHSS